MKRRAFIAFIFFLFGFINLSLNTLSESHNLFHVARSKDINIIKYDVNITSSGKINLNNPLSIYWVRKTAGSKVESLSFIQNNFAYGVKYISKTDDELIFHFVSYPSRLFMIKKLNGTYQALAVIEGKSAILNKIYVQIDGGTFMLPKISYVKLEWTDVDSGKDYKEIIKP